MINTRRKRRVKQGVVKCMRRITIVSMILVLFVSTLISFGSTIKPVKAESFESCSDDFSGDSGLWQYLGEAYRDTTNQYLVLNKAGYQRSGAAFFKAPVSGPFTASFRYKAGEEWSGDGFTLFFYKQEYTSIGSGGSLGFTPYQNMIVPGYAIEFDGWQNIPSDFQQFDEPTITPAQGDPSPYHIALIEGYVGNHLTYVNDRRVSDDNWHQVSIEVQTASVRVFVDQGLVLQWNGTLDRTYSGFGFSGATGGGGCNAHYIDDFSLNSKSLQTPILTTSCVSSVSASSFNVKINGDLTFNGSAISGAPILLSYSVTDGDSWQNLTTVHTGSDGSFSASWLLSVTGDYQLKAVFKGSEKYLATSNIVNFAIQPCSEQSVFSVDSNSTITNLAFNSTSQELCFGVSGDSGTTGYIEVYIPKSLVSDASNLKVYLDNNQIDYTSKSQSDFWLLYFSYNHSRHMVTISLSAATPFNIQIQPIVIAAIIIIIVVAGTSLVYVEYRLYHKKQKAPK